MPGLHANPVPYLALSFGHKVHMDQNEKLAMYGVTHVAARHSDSLVTLLYARFYHSEPRVL